ncbi:hypothetical protein Gogos_012290 [Gossypium gossypioides]|uniref:Uncharacterized protein n=1 Tax=Gossypium gossypioides TaxID=34282 RepID=A0A7J9BS28_GOSGO|nr:hypothetical protein [Gossypium gossypioides]
MDEKRSRLKESGRELAVSWALCAVCLIGHVAHFLGAKASWMHAFHSTGFHLSLSLFTLLGPGRQLIFEGVKNLFKGAPNMNTLVGLGALSSFAVSSLAVLIPKLVSLDTYSYLCSLWISTFVYVDIRTYEVQ